MRIGARVLGLGGGMSRARAAIERLRERARGEATVPPRFKWGARVDTRRPAARSGDASAAAQPRRIVAADRVER